MIDRACGTCGGTFKAHPSTVKFGGAKHCSWECRRRRHERTMLERFWAKVAKTDTCWLWTGHGNGKGYGTVRINRVASYVHRFVWELERGPVRDGLCVCHRCDVRNCVNPDHLFLGTHRDNTRDMMRKGRAVFAGIPQRATP